MPESTMSQRAWRFDLVEDTPTTMGTNLVEDGQPGCAGDVIDCRGGPALTGSGVASFHRWWTPIARRALKGWFHFLDGGRARFEEELHAFAAGLTTAQNPDAVQASLLRLVRRIAPGSRVELIQAEDQA